MLQPLGKRILIQHVITEKKPNLLILKEETPKTFKVISIGDEVTKIKVDDIIYIADYSTTEIKYNDDKFLILLEENIIAKIQ